MLILFDQGTPVPLRAFLIGHTIKTAARLRVQSIVAAVNAVIPGTCAEVEIPEV